MNRLPVSPLQLFPCPQQWDSLDEHLNLPERPRIAVSPSTDGVRQVGQRLAEGLERLGFQTGSVDVFAAAGSKAEIELSTRPEELREEQAYVLQIDGRGVRIRAADPPGLFYGVCTLLQWIRAHQHADGSNSRKLAGLRVHDRPDFAQRGVLLDISRDRVPTLETLFELVDLLASWKINQLQLYTEHTFAYEGHEAVWRHASPITPTEIRELDAYCRSRWVELVPNQNSFGHFHRWLVHEAYRPLAECPEGLQHPFSAAPEPFSLCPLDPRSLALLEDLYDQLLPNFTSHLFNAGLDETFDLGRGRSRTACAQRGSGRIYLEFLLQVYRLVRSRGRRMQFWGDIVLNHPDLVTELPENVIPLLWGYEADHPFADSCRTFADSGLDYYVCPGTSSWNSFGGRSRNALVNLAAAAEQGRRHGAQGLLNTDWGDGGHLQPLPVSYLGLLAGAGFSWNVASARGNVEEQIAGHLDRHAFHDPAGVVGRVALELGNAYLHTGAGVRNGSALFYLLMSPETSLQQTRYAGIDQKALDTTLNHLDEAAALLDAARIERRDADLVRAELRWVADTLRLACRLIRERLQVGASQPLDAIRRSRRRSLAKELEDLIDRHRENWLARSRPGGLADSAGRMQRVRDRLSS